ncbi:hypothetical protein TU79_17635 [Pseudomonas trivialis]|uniref:Uncharacterized protein n=1 Tax=Pseudomonas trivialis TaxID=200450 RepID=A0A0R2ZF83_9PSED|nr:hypothetical protein TU79_17635 [Pseudomonas trivialis]
MIPIHFRRVLQHQWQSAGAIEQTHKNITPNLHVISLEMLIYMQKLMRPTLRRRHEPGANI